MLYIGYLIILNGHNIKKISFGNFDFGLLSTENCITRLCALDPLGAPPPPPPRRPQHPNSVKNT